ncbi:MAG: lysozyme inhibitor LprI family protein [Pseudomonadota bacterium]
MNQKLAIAGSVAALVSAFFPIYLHFSEQAAPAQAAPARAVPVQPVQVQPAEIAPRVTSPGFNCAKASTATEVTICQSEQLARLDRSLNARYDTLTFDMDETTLTKLRAAQATWRRERDGCRTDVPCIAAAYEVRLEMLSDLLDRR